MNKKNRRARRRAASKKNGSNVTLVAEGAPEVKVAQEMADLNDRDRAIQKRLGQINAESSKLCAEQAGIALRREKLRREFDTVSAP